DHSSQGRQYRQNGLSECRKLTLDDFPLDLHAHHQEENDHQSVVHPVQDGMIQRKITCIDPDVRIPEFNVAFPCPTIGKNDRKQGAYNQDRKSTRLNSSHVKISYAVFCLKKKKKKKKK